MGVGLDLKLLHTFPSVSTVRPAIFVALRLQLSLCPTQPGRSAKPVFFQNAWDMQRYINLMKLCPTSSIKYQTAAAAAATAAGGSDDNGDDNSDNHNDHDRDNDHDHDRHYYNGTDDGSDDDSDNDHDH